MKRTENLPSPCCFRTLLLIVALLVAAAARADRSPFIASLPVAVTAQCGFLGDCAHTDAIGLHLGTTAAVRFRDGADRVGLSGWVHGSLTLLDVAEFGGALGGHFEQVRLGEQQTATAPALLFAKLRLYPLPWQPGRDGGLQLATSYQRSLVSENLGAQEQPGFDLNTARLLARRSFGPVDVDLGVGMVFGDQGPAQRRAVEASASAALRISGLARPRSPAEQLQVMVQALYRVALPGSIGAAADGFLLFAVHQRSSSGYGFGLGAGPQFIEQSRGGLILVSFDLSWGLRYRNPVAESKAGQPPWVPGVWMNLFSVDPVLEADGCVWTDPNPVIGRMQIKCVGQPDAAAPKQVLLPDGRRFPIGTHLWIRNDGALITQRLESVAQLDPNTTERTLWVQQLGHYLHHAEDKAQKPCKFKASILNGVTDPGLAAQLAHDDFGGAAALLGVELGRQIVCGDSDLLSGGGFLPYLGKGVRGGPLRHRQPLPDGGGASEHAQPSKPEVTLPDNARSHIFYGDVDAKMGRSRGWHYESSADRAKGTYVKEGTRAAPDQHGVYEANVVIEGVQKKERSSFFPKHWSQEQVEKAILEAYQNAQPAPFNASIVRGKTSAGMSIEIRLKGGEIQTAFPLYNGR